MPAVAAAVAGNVGSVPEVCAHHHHQPEASSTHNHQWLPCTRCIRSTRITALHPRSEMAQRQQPGLWSDRHSARPICLASYEACMQHEAAGSRRDVRE